MIDCTGVLRIVSFSLHFLSAIFLAFVAARCGGAFSSHVYAESSTDLTGYEVISPQPPCDLSVSKDFKCFLSNTKTYDVNQDGMKLNVLALLAAFEWVSASFGLYYLYDVDSSWFYWAPVVSNIWNAAGVIIFMPYTMPLDIFQLGVTALTFLVSSMAQINATFKKKEYRAQNSHDPFFFPFTGVTDSRGYNVIVSNDSLQKLTPTQTILHYTEYCTSASLLFIAVSVLFMPDPLSWNVAVAFVSILLCNLTGIGAHYCKLDQHNTTPTAWYDLDWSKPGNHFKLFMFHSWSALLLALTILIYTSWNSLSSTDVPLFVRFTLYNLLVTYSAFGIWATVCYAFAGSRLSDFTKFNKWMVRLDYGLTILSLAAKLPVAYAVFYGLVAMPGSSNICKVFG